MCYQISKLFKRNDEHYEAQHTCSNNDFIDEFWIKTNVVSGEYSLGSGHTCQCDTGSRDLLTSGNKGHSTSRSYLHSPLVC